MSFSHVLMLFFIRFYTFLKWESTNAVNETTKQVNNTYRNTLLTDATKFSKIEIFAVTYDGEVDEGEVSGWNGLIGTDAEPPRINFDYKN